MRTGLIINIILITILFITYLYIRKEESKSFMGFHVLADIFTFNVVPVILFITNLIVFVSSKHYIFLLYTLVIILPFIYNSAEEKNINKNSNLATMYSIMIIETILKKLPKLNKDKINLIFNLENNHVKIVITDNDLEYNHTQKKYLEDEINKVTELTVELLIDKEKEL